MTDITGYVNLALVLVGVWFVFSVHRLVKQIAEDVRVIRTATTNQGVPPAARDDPRPT